MLVPDFDGLTARVEELIGRAELTLALEEIWERVRRLNRYVEEQAPWQLAKDDARAGELDRVLGHARRGVARRRRVAVALPAGELRAAARRARRGWGGSRSIAGGRRARGGKIARVEKIESLFPKEV